MAIAKIPRFAVAKSLRYLCFAGLLLAVWALFRMLEPVLTWSSGWQGLPSESAFAAVSDSAALTKPALTDLATQPDVTQPDVTRRANAALRESRARLQAPALSAAVMLNGKRVWAAAVGFADIAQAKPVNLHSRFRLGSSSKTLNALTMARLIDAGKVDIERSVRHYLPELPSSYQAVTTRMAITHTAGVPHYGLCFCFPIWEHKNRRHFDNARAALGVFVDRPLRFTPGSNFQYSSYGTNLVGAVLESASGQNFPELVAAQVLMPLRMVDSKADIFDTLDAQRVQFYEVTEGRYKLADPTDNSIRYPAGGMLSTPSDMLAAGNALLVDGFLSNATRVRLLNPQKLSDGSMNPQNYALGIRVFDAKKLFQERVTTRFYSHHGTAIGSTSYFAVYPEYRMVISIMMNKGQENLDALGVEANAIAELFIAPMIAKSDPP